jgi:hypothetical protein
MFISQGAHVSTSILSRDSQVQMEIVVQTYLYIYKLYHYSTPNLSLVTGYRFPFMVLPHSRPVSHNDKATNKAVQSLIKCLSPQYSTHQNWIAVSNLRNGKEKRKREWKIKNGGRRGVQGARRIDLYVWCSARLCSKLFTVSSLRGPPRRDEAIGLMGNKVTVRSDLLTCCFCPHPGDCFVVPPRNDGLLKG